MKVFLNTLEYIVIFLILFSFQACNQNLPALHINSIQDDTNEIWFKQARTDLGYRIEMKNVNEGVAISRGKGTDVKGKLLIFNNGEWIEKDQFDYSDYPAVAYHKNSIWYLTHDTHVGFYRPNLYEINKEGNSKRRLKLPKVMWDKTDYSMWLGISTTKSGEAWMVGQRGNIVRFEGKKWVSEVSPAKVENAANFSSGDLHDVQMLSDTLGWAIGKEGVILRYSSGRWKKFLSPVTSELYKISMSDVNSGWVVGDKGTILKYENDVWKEVKNNFRVTFNSVKTIDNENAWIVGSRSTLLNYENGLWKENKSIKVFDDTFIDLDVIKDNENEFKIWIIGNNGIYTNSQGLNFSFTDITSKANLRNDGTAGIFFNYNNDELPELLINEEAGPNVIYKNLGGYFSEIEKEVPLDRKITFNQTSVVGEINGDSYDDLIEVFDDLNYSIVFGGSGFDFKYTDPNGRLKLNYVQNDLSRLSTQLIDFDNDGDLDIYFSNYNYNDMLFENDGIGNFQNVIDKSGIKKLLNHRAYGTIFSDFNNDNLIDVLITYKLAEKGKHISLYMNQGDLKFLEKDDENFYNEISPSTLSAIAADFNNDGFSDLIIFNNSEKLKFLLNNGDASFENVTNKTGLTGKFFHPDPSNGILNTADINNDGWLDLFIGSRLFVGSSEIKFKEVGDKVGLDFAGNPSFADIDNDGDVDLFIGSSKAALGPGKRSALLRNNLYDKRFVKFRLNTDVSNKNAIGSKVFLSAFNKEDKLVYNSLREVGLGNSPIAQQNLEEVHFGANPEFNYKAKIEFPSGIVKKITDVPFNKTITVLESSFLQHYLILVRKSFKRSLKLLNPWIEIIKFSILLLLLTASIKIAQRTKAKKIAKKWFYPTTLVIVYFLLVHFTVEVNQLLSSVIIFVSTGLLMFLFIYFSSKQIDKKESRYISHYKIVDILGVGGMGKVFKAIDTQNKNTVALKILNSHLLKDEENKKRLNSEGRLLSELNHSNIVKVYEFGESEKHSFIAMEYLPGGTLEEYIDNNYPLSSSEIIQLSIQICEGLIQIHQHEVLHRDLKAANIMLDEENNIKIMDFGLSKSPLVSTMTSLGTVVGTLGFVAPEQITNIKVDQRTDIFSLGVIIYKMITNKLPFTGENEMALIHSIFNTTPPRPSEINGEVPKELERIVIKCIQKEAGDRYNTASEIREDLLNIKL